MKMNAEKSIIEFKREHEKTWRDKPDWYWFVGLVKEVWELGSIHYQVTSSSTGGGASANIRHYHELAGKTML